MASVAVSAGGRCPGHGGSDRRNGNGEADAAVMAPRPAGAGNPCVGAGRPRGSTRSGPGCRGARGFDRGCGCRRSRRCGPGT